MAKYSIDDSDSDDEQPTGTTCELCGTETDALEMADVAGANLEVCPDCSPHDEDADPADAGTRDADESDRTTDAVRKASQAAPNPDSSWAEDGTNYVDDQLPYLVENYGDRVEEARDEKDMTQEDLADKAGIGIAMLRVIENGQAVQSSIGRNSIEDVATVLEIDIIDD